MIKLNKNTLFGIVTTILIIIITLLTLNSNYETSNSINELKDIVSEDIEQSDFPPRLEIDSDEITLRHTLGKSMTYGFNPIMSITSINKNPLELSISDIMIAEDIFINNCYFKTPPTILSVSGGRGIIGIESNTTLIISVYLNYQTYEHFNTFDTNNEFKQYFPVALLEILLTATDIKTSEKYQKHIPIAFIAPFSQEELDVFTNMDCYPFEE